MRVVRNALILVVVVGGAFLVLSLDRRASLAEKLAEARRLVSRRATDREARASRMASETWEGEGGAIPAAGAELR
jgi:hypothetical protein